jgi:hypothetical protein
MTRFLRVLAVPSLLCWCCSFCVTTSGGDPLAVYGGAPGAYEIPVTTFAVVPF